MVRKFADKRTQQFAQGKRVPAFSGFERQVNRRIAILLSAPSLGSLKELQSNRLEILRGDRLGQYSIRINDQWRICFTWSEHESGPLEIEIVDDH